MAETPNLKLPLIDQNMTADVVRDMNALAEAVDNAAETKAGAQAKANTAEQNAKDYTDGKVADQATKTEFDNHVDSSSVHGANPNAVANRIIIRDGAGRASIATPIGDGHIANKGYVDTEAAQAETRAKNYAEQQAEAAERNAKSASVNKIADYTGDGINPNTTTSPFILTNHSNKPAGDSNWYYIETLFYQESGNRMQRAQGYNNHELWIRYYNSGTWYPWISLWTKQNLPNPAQKDGTLQANLNAEMLSGMRATFLDTPDTIMRRDSQGGTRVRRIDTTNVTINSDGNRTLWFVDENGNNKGLLFHNEATGSMILRVYDTSTTYRELSVNPAQGLRYQGSDVWNSNNQGNPNNLNTASKQVVGAINELFTTVSDGKQAIRDAIADNGGTPPAGSPNQYTHQDLANAISTVSKYKSGTTPSQTTVQIRGIPFEVDVFTFFYQTSDDGGITVLFTDVNSPFIRKTNTTAADPVITPVSGGFNLTLDRPAGTNMTWEAWGGRD